MARVFISYASKDLAVAQEVHPWLTEAGHDVFLDQDPRDGIALGEQWRSRLQERLRWADAVVCVVTSAYLARVWCSAEVGMALSRGSRLLPVRAEPGLTHPLLAEIQHTDLTKDRVMARIALIAALRQIDAAGGPGWADDRSPFPGLRPFDVDRHQVFFGRDKEIKQLAELVRSGTEGAVLPIVGPSGCGKSSLVRAGLRPVLCSEPGWQALEPIVPGVDPVAALARELAATARRIGLDWTLEQVHQQLDTRGLTALADELLVADPRGPQRRLLIVVDQFEELLTQTPPGQQTRFAELLSPALHGPVQVVATLRSEFLDQLLTNGELADLRMQLYYLRPLRREALRLVIEKPARLAGFDVDEDLVIRLVDDTDTGKALPLLAFTLAQLAEGVSRGGQLSAARYDQLGGVEGALTRQADDALAAATAASGRRRERVIAELLLRRLVTVDDQGRPTRWRVNCADLSTLEFTELNAFVTRRLLTSDTDNGIRVIGVAHEAFLSAWPPLAEAITANVTALRARRPIEQAATEWHDGGHPPARLWGGGQLAAARADTGARIRASSTPPPQREGPARWLPRRHRELVTELVDLSPKAREFLHASIRRDRLQRGRAITVLSALLILAVVAAGIAIAAQRVAEQQRNVAVSQKVTAQALALRATNPALAAQLGLAAYRLVPSPETRGSLLSIVANPDATRLTGHTNAVKGVAFSPDGHTLAASSDDKTVQLWDISAPHHPHLLSTLTGHTHYVASVAFSPDGHVLATASDDSTARLWDIGDPRQPHPLATLTGHAGVVSSVAFSQDGFILATGSFDNTARLWDIRDPGHPSPLSTLTGHTSGVTSVAFSADGHTVASSSFDDTARLWDVHNPRQPSPLSTLTGHTGIVSSVAFSADGHTMASGSSDRTVRLWDIHDLRQPRLLSTLAGHTGGVFSVAFSTDGHTMASSSSDRTVRLWDVHDLRRPGPMGTLTGHTNIVYSVAFSPDGHTLATGSYDNTARLWSLSGPIVGGHTSIVSSVAFNPDGRILATASRDRTVWLCDVRDPHQLHPLATLTGHTDGIDSVAFNSDGHVLATASSDRTVRLWDVRDPHQLHPLATLTGHTDDIYSVAFSPDGHILATGSSDSTARLWDIRDPRQASLLATLTDTGDIFSVAFSPDGHALATGTDDNIVRLWDVRNSRQPSLLATISGHTSDVFSVAFSSDGHTLATASGDSTARLWDIHDPHQPSLLAVLTGHESSVKSVAFSPDGHALATASSDNTVRLWDVHDFRHPLLLDVLTGHDSSVNSVAFSPDGHTLATSSSDSTAHLWETNVDNVTARICSTTPTISQSEWNQYLPGLPYQPPCP